jgi:hypothetical protein
LDARSAPECELSDLNLGGKAAVDSIGGIEVK